MVAVQQQKHLSLSFAIETIQKLCISVRYTQKHPVYMFATWTIDSQPKPKHGIQNRLCLFITKKLKLILTLE